MHNYLLKIFWLLGFLVLIHFSTPVFAYFDNYDSLKLVYAKPGLSIQDKLSTLLRLAKTQVDDNPKECIKYSNEGIELCNKDRKKHTLTIAKFLLYKCAAFQSQSQYGPGMKFAMEGLTLAKQLKDDKLEAQFYIQIGNNYQYIRNFEEAIKYYRKGGEVFEKLKSYAEVAICINNEAVMYEYLLKQKEAEKLYAKLIEFAEEKLEREEWPMYYMNYGDFLRSNNNNKLAIYYQQKALALYQEYKQLDELAVLYLGMSFNYCDLKDFKNAKTAIDSANYYAHKISDKRIQTDVEEGYANFYYESGNYKLAFDYLQRNRDTLLELIGKENAEQINEYQAKYESAEKENQIKLLNTEKDLQKEEIRKNNILIYGGGIVLIILLLLSLIIYRSLSYNKKANLLLKKQKEEIYEQKILVEEKHQEIKDSINYARRIQTALIPGEEFKRLLPHSFILFKPKDVVSGDFYWVGELVKNDEKIYYYATADCTGHGVPGAFMSMLGISLLNEILFEKKIEDPGTMLNELRRLIIQSLKQSGAIGESKDGMDMSLIAINVNKREIKYASANNPIWIFSPELTNYTLTELKAQKSPVGFSDEMIPFETKAHPIKQSDLIVTFTDGYADQFGGPSGKKLKYKPFEKLIGESLNYGLPEQKEILDQSFESWKGELEQVDDVLVIGLKIL